MSPGANVGNGLGWGACSPHARTPGSNVHLRSAAHTPAPAPAPPDGDSRLRPVQLPATFDVPTHIAQRGVAAARRMITVRKFADISAAASHEVGPLACCRRGLQGQGSSPSQREQRLHRHM